MAQEKPRPKRIYHIWKGNNRFFCGGRFVFGPDVASLLLSATLIAGPAIAFCIKIYFIIRHRIGEGKEANTWLSCACSWIVAHDPGNWYSFFIFLNSYSTCLYYSAMENEVHIGPPVHGNEDITFLFLTSSRDPGIVPRSPCPPESAETYDINTPSMEWVNDRTPHLKLPRSKDVIVNGHAVKVKYRDICLSYHPPCAAHCSICNNCVQRFDHHSPWVGQCIGITTNENFRYRYDTKENPYNRGMFNNFKEVFLPTIPPSMNDYRTLFLEDENQQVEPPNLNIVEGLANSKEKIDIEMGTKLAEDGGLSLPEILQNLDDDEIEDNLKTKDLKQNSADPSLFPIEPESIDSLMISTEADGKTDSEPSSFLVQEGKKNPVNSTTIKNAINAETNTQNSDYLCQIITSSPSKK